MSNSKSFKIENGMAYFGNKYFYFESSIDKEKKESNVKNKFFEEIFKSFFEKKMDNFSLLLNKFVSVLNVSIIKNKSGDTKSYEWYSLKEASLNEESKKWFLENFIKNCSYVFNGINYNNHHSHIIDSLQEENFKLIFYEEISTFSPLICGLGSTSVLETSITLHHIWGVPYIPASSLKGVCRQVAFWKLAKNKDIADENDLKGLQEKFYGNLNFENEEMLKYQLLFGAQDFKGLLLFLDVFPDLSNENSKNPFRLDIMNPHYSSYYGDDTGKTPPGDWDNPVPIYFLTVKKGIPFHFSILLDEFRWEKTKQFEFEVEKDNKKEKKKIPDSIKNKVENVTKENKFFENIIKEALDFYGVGSKTRLGYGNFKV